MKLYEFAYADNQNLSEAELGARIEAFLQNECENQDWAPGYQFRQDRSPESLPQGGKNYFFEVLGEYLDTENLDSSGESKSTPPPPTPLAALPEAGL